MSTTVQERPAATTAAGDHECHYVCCDEDVAMCGEDVTGHEWCDDDGHEATCVPCRAVHDCGLPCPVLGCAGDANAA